MNDKEKDLMISYFDQHIEDIAREQYEFEVSELGSIHASSEDRYLEPAFRASGIFQDALEQHGADLPSILNLSYDEQSGFDFDLEISMEEYPDHFEYLINEHEATLILKSLPNYNFFDSRLIRLAIFAKDELKLLNFENVSNENEYTDVFLKGVANSYRNALNFESNPLFDHIIDRINDSFIFDVVDHLSKNVNVNSYLYDERSPLMKDIFSNLLQIKDKFDCDNISNDKNKKLLRLIDKVNEGYFSKNLLHFTVREKEFTLFDLTIDKISEFFNKDSLSKNHFFKEISRMIENEICQSKNEVPSNFRLPYPHYQKKVVPINEKKDNEIIEDIVIRTEEVVDLFKINSNLLKSNKDKLDINNIDTIESLFDRINEIVEEATLKKYVKKIIGSYHHLKNDENIELIKEIKDKKIDLGFVKKELKNIALMDEPERLSDALKNIIAIDADQLSPLKLEHMLKNEEIKGEILFKTQDKKIALIMDDLNTASKIAPSRWCITKSQQLFSNYKTDGHNVIFFDFNKNNTDPDHIIGISVRGDNSVRNIFNKNNGSVRSLDNVWKEEFVSFFKSKLDLNTLNKEVKQFQEHKLTINNVTDPIYVLNKTKSYDVSDDVLNDLITTSLLARKVSDTFLMDNLIKLNEAVPHLGVFEINDVKAFAEEIKHPIAFLNSKETQSQDQNQKRKIKYKP